MRQIAYSLKERSKTEHESSSATSDASGPLSVVCGSRRNRSVRTLIGLRLTSYQFPNNAERINGLTSVPRCR